MRPSPPLSVQNWGGGIGGRAGVGGGGGLWVGGAAGRGGGLARDPLPHTYLPGVSVYGGQTSIAFTGREARGRMGREAWQSGQNTKPPQGPTRHTTGPTMSPNPKGGGSHTRTGPGRPPPPPVGERTAGGGGGVGAWVIGGGADWFPVNNGGRRSGPRSVAPDQRVQRWTQRLRAVTVACHICGASG